MGHRHTAEVDHGDHVTDADFFIVAKDRAGAIRVGKKRQLVSLDGVEVGARLATALPETTVRRLFALLLFAVAAHLVWRTRRQGPRYPESP